MAYPYQPQPSASAAVPPPSATHIAIIGPEYHATIPVDLAIVRKVMSLSGGNFVVTDINGTIIFRINQPLMTLCDHRVLIDATGKSLVTLRRKVCLHSWIAFNIYVLLLLKFSLNTYICLILFL